MKDRLVTLADNLVICCEYMENNRDFFNINLLEKLIAELNEDSSIKTSNKLLNNKNL